MGIHPNSWVEAINPHKAHFGMFEFLIEERKKMSEERCLHCEDVVMCEACAVRAHSNTYEKGEPVTSKEETERRTGRPVWGRPPGEPTGSGGGR